MSCGDFFVCKCLNNSPNMKNVGRTEKQRTIFFLVPSRLRKEILFERGVVTNTDNSPPHIPFRLFYSVRKASRHTTHHFSPPLVTNTSTADFPPPPQREIKQQQWQMQDASTRTDFCEVSEAWHSFDHGRAQSCHAWGRWWGGAHPILDQVRETDWMSAGANQDHNPEIEDLRKRKKNSVCRSAPVCKS